MPGDEEIKGGKRSAWMAHVKKTMKAHPNLSLKAALKLASKTRKSMKGGSGTVTPLPIAGGPAEAPAGASLVGGRRRRGSRKTRKSRGSRKH